MKFTTKINTKTGPYRSFQPSYAQIKSKKKVCGFIVEERGGTTKVWFHIKKEPTEDNPAPFKNVKLLREFERFEDALSAVRAMNRPSWSDKIHFLD